LLKDPFEDKYARVFITGVEYRIYWEYSREQIKKSPHLFPRAQRVLVVEKAQPFPIVGPSDRQFFYSSFSGNWAMRPIDKGGRPRNYIRDVIFRI
jgi:hypothetical protein